jgi:hypothetical protein
MFIIKVNNDDEHSIRENQIEENQTSENQINDLSI